MSMLALPKPAERLALPSPLTDAPGALMVHELYDAYHFYNRVLFGNKLAIPTILLQRKRTAFGYFWNDKFKVNGKGYHEIAMNPDHLWRDAKECLSTLVHEMVHLWQQDHGKRSKVVHHNKEWARKMEVVGLKPFNVKDPKKKTGMRCSHHVIEGGKFDVATDELLATGFKLSGYGLSKHMFLFGLKGGLEGIEGVELVKPKPYRTTFKCPVCGDTALAKTNAKLMCANKELHGANGELQLMYDKREAGE